MVLKSARGVINKNSSLKVRPEDNKIYRPVIVPPKIPRVPLLRKDDKECKKWSSVNGEEEEKEDHLF